MTNGFKAAAVQMRSGQDPERNAADMERLVREAARQETQATLVRWSLYCQARAALTLYPWASLREQCLGLLRQYLDRSEMFSPPKNLVIAKVGQTLPKVMQ